MGQIGGKGGVGGFGDGHLSVACAIGWHDNVYYLKPLYPVSGCYPGKMTSGEREDRIARYNILIQNPWLQLCVRVGDYKRNLTTYYHSSISTV